MAAPKDDPVIDSPSALLRHRTALADALRATLDPAWFEFGGNDRLALVFDLEMHLAFLGEALRFGLPRLFSEYAAWTYQLLVSAGGDGQRFELCLLAIERALRERARGAWVSDALATLADSRARMFVAPPASASHFRDENPHRALSEAFLRACLELRRPHALALVQEAVARGVPVTEVYLDVITPAMHELGRLWHLNQVSVAQEHYCTAVAQMVMALLFPAVFDGTRRSAGRLVSVCVAGELHEIGARMVADLFEMSGWDTVFLGADVPTDSVIHLLVESRADVLAISVTLAANLSHASELIDAVRASAACAGMRIIVGGAAFNVEPALWERIGVDGWAPDAQGALQLAGAWRRPA